MIALLGLGIAAGIAMIFGAGCALALLLRLIRELPDTPETESEDEDGGGGGSKRPEPPGPADRGGGEPPWWPQFERDFAAYVDRVSAVARR
jgi:hypothetical protein